MAEKKQEIVKKERNITDNVLERFIQTKQANAIDVPSDYSAENALKSAWFMLQTVKNSSKKLALDVCAPESIANSLYEMVVNGLNPMKKQCYFIVYGSELTCMTSYQGNVALAKRFSKVKSVIPKEIHKDDVFETEIFSDGREVLSKHVQPFKNLDNDIIGGYCVVIDSEDKEHLTKMTMKDIKKSWLKSFTKGNGDVHKNFTGEMVKRTLINRATKPWINSSNDESIIEDRVDSPEEENNQPVLKIECNDTENELDHNILDNEGKLEPNEEFDKKPEAPAPDPIDDNPY